MRVRECFFVVASCLVCAAAAAAPAPLDTLTLGNDTAGIGIDPGLAKAFVTNYTSGTLSVINLATNTVDTFNVGANPRRLVIDAARHRVYFVNDTAAGSVSVFDAQTNAVIAGVPVGSRPRSIAADFQVHEVYAGNRDSNSISIIDTRTNNVVATVPVGQAPGGIDVNRLLGKIYVASGPDNTVSIIDQATRTVKTVAVGKNPGFARADIRTGKVYVNNVDDKTVSVIDSNDTVIKTIPVGAGTAFNFAASSPIYRRIYLANALDNTVTFIDTDTDTVVRTVPVGAAPQDVSVDNGDGDLYVVNQGSNSVTVIDARTETVTGTLPVGGSPWRMATGLDRMLVLNTNGAAPDSITIATEQETLGNTEIANEWYHGGFNHYFHAATEVENRVLNDGIFGTDWNRTYQFWRVWTQAAPGLQPVCRFFSATFAPRSSHFFTPYPAECESLKAGGVWQYEGTLYFLALPDAGGSCGPGTVPLYRLYNNGLSGAPNHRYTADVAVRDQMAALGWIGEGSGANVVFACTPTLRGD